MATGNPNVRRDADYAMGWGCAWWWFIWLILLIIFFGGGWWWGGWYGPTPWQGQRTAQAPPTGPTTVQAPGTQANAPATPGEFLNRDVTLTGKVDAVLGDQAFTLVSPAAGGPGLLVVAQAGASPHPALKTGETVKVTGTVHPFNRTEFDKDAKVNLPQDATQAYVGRPAILATAVSEVSSQGNHPQGAPQRPSGS